MRPFLVPIVLVPTVMLLLSVSDGQEAPNCTNVPLYPEVVDGAYPAYRMSPEESYDHYDTIFVGEVVVPTRKCSLGYCAGLRVSTPMKGEESKNYLVRLTHTDKSCGATKFHHKGVKWLVFGNLGTSHRGNRYLEVEDGGPSFETEKAPDFKTLQANYMTLRAHLDRAIKDAIPRLDQR